MRVLDSLGLRATAAVNATAATRYPRVIDEIVRRNWEIVANGIDMGHVHHGQLELETERELIRRARETLTNVIGPACHRMAFSGAFAVGQYAQAARRKRF